MANMQLLVDQIMSTVDFDSRSVAGEKLFNEFSPVDQAAMGFLPSRKEAQFLNPEGVAFEGWPNQIRKIAFHAIVTGGHGLPVRIKNALAKGNVFLAGSVDQMDNAFPQMFKAEGVLKSITECANILAPNAWFIEAEETLDAEVRKQIADRLLTPNKLMDMLLTEHGVYNGETLVKMLRAFGAELAAVSSGTFVYKGRHKSWQIRVTDQGVFFDDKEFCPNTFVSGRIDGNAEHKIQPWKATILTLGYVLQGFDDSDVAGRQAFNTEAFIEGPGGAQKDQRSSMVKRHKVGVVAAVAGANFDLYVRNDSSVEENNRALQAFLELKVPAGIQHQGDYIVVGDGARAMGLGFNVAGNIIAMYVADKATKFANRAALGIAPSAWSEIMEDSNYKLMTSEGPVGTKGVRVQIRSINTNSVAMGSGNAIVPEDFELSVGSSRVVRTAVLQSRTKSSPAAQEAEIMAELKVYSKVPSGSYIAAQKVGVDAEGKEILRPIEGLRWDVDATTLVVDKWEVKAQHNSNDVKVIITGSWKAKSIGEKLKVDGGKMRTVMGEVVTRDKEFNLLPAYKGVSSMDETNKGQQLHLVMWAHSDKEFFEDKGALVMDPSKPMSREYRERYTWWVTENTRWEWVGMRKNRKSYIHFKAMFENDPTYRFIDETREIYHFTTVLYGEMVTPIEYTTTYENSGTSQAYPELVMAMERVSPRLAALYWSQGNEMRGAYRDLFACFKGKQTDLETFVVDGQTTLFDLSLFDEEDKLVWEITPDMFHGRSTKAIMKTLAKRFPNGCRVVTDSKIVMVDFNALSKVDNYVTGGKSVGPANEIAMLFSALASDPAERDQGFGSFVTSRLNKYTRELRSLFENSGACRRPMRSGKLFTRKVANSDAWWVDPWTVYFNPNDPLITSGKIKVDEHYGVGRMPMISFGMFKVALHKHVAIGTFLVDPFSWAACNEGDADGDGGFLFLIPDHLVEEVRDSLKTGIFGPRGYKAVYVKLPYEDFMKSSPSKAPIPVPGNEMFWDKDGIFNWHGSEISPEAMVELHMNLGKHYRANVGTGYQVATYLLYWVSRNSTQRKDLSRDVVAAQELACVWAWRVLYEKQGLGGYDPKTIVINGVSVRIYELMWTQLDELARKYMKATLFSPETGTYVANTEKRDELVDQFVNLINKMSEVSDLKPLNRTVASYILRARALGIMGAMLESGKALDNALVGECKLAAEFLLIRRASKGLLASERNQENAYDNRHCAVDILDRVYRKAEGDDNRFPQEISSLKHGLYASMLQGMYDLHRNAVAAVREERNDRQNRLFGFGMND